MKKTLKIIGGVFAAFFALVVILLITDISNDVEYKVVEEKPQKDSYYLRVTSEATSEDALKTVMEDIKEKYDKKNVDAIWIWFHDESDEPYGKNVASARIAYNNKGKAMIGAEKEEFVFEMKK